MRVVVYIPSRVSDEECKQRRVWNIVSLRIKYSVLSVTDSQVATSTSVNLRRLLRRRSRQLLLGIIGADCTNGTLCVDAGTVAETSTYSSACSSAAIGHTARFDSTNVNVVRLPQSNIFSDSVLS